MNNVLVGVSFLLVVLNYFGALMQTGAATLSIALLALLTIVFLFQVGIIYFMFKPNAIAYLLFILIMFIRALDSLVLVQIDPVSGWANLTLTGGILVFTIYMKITMFPFQNILHLREDQNGIRIFQSSPSC
ncbi:MAG: hypothetical protein R3F41_19125 [Gammaproteobacteria bacterium]|nr:hypothetical protein [Pseudomonadales bacterium]